MITVGLVELVFAVSSSFILGVEAYVECKGNIYVDGKMMNDEWIDNEWRSIIPRTTRLIAIEAENYSDRRWIYAVFSNAAILSNDFKSSSQWKCSTMHHSDWATIHFDDSTDDWGDAKETDTGDDHIWEASDADGKVYCRGWIGTAYTFDY